MYRSLSFIILIFLLLLLVGCPNNKIGTATVTCSDQDILTDVGWSNFSQKRQLGDLFIATLGNVGDEECVSAQRHSTIRDAQTKEDEPTGSLEAKISRGLTIQFGVGVPANVKMQTKIEFVDEARVLLKNYKVEWLEAPKRAVLDSSEADDFLQELSLPGRFGFLVTRLYSAEKLEDSSSSAYDSTNTIEYSEYVFEIQVSYKCEAFTKVNKNVPVFYDGIFLELVDGFLATKPSVPQRFCPGYGPDGTDEYSEAPQSFEDGGL